MTRVMDRLDRAELERLSAFKWRYSFEAMGFDKGSAAHLAFLTWLHASGRVQP